MENFSEETRFLNILSEIASRIMLRHYSPAGVCFETKSDSSPVTAVDVEINQIAIDLIKTRFPDYGVLGEEISVNTGTTDKLFVIDPLDGTRMFTLGVPLFAFSAAIVIDGQSTAGIITNPLIKRTLIAERGKGTYLLGRDVKKVFVSNKDDFKQAVINTGWMDSKINTVLHKEGSFTPELYSACEAGSLVALGKFDAMIFLGKSAHDIAAVKVIVEEAGGKVTDIYGKEQSYNIPISGALVSNGGLHDKLLRIVKESRVQI